MNAPCGSDTGSTRVLGAAMVCWHLALGTVLGCAAGGAEAPVDILGSWAGTATFRGAVLDVSVLFTRHGDSLAGVFTAPDITLLDQPLASILYGPNGSRTPVVRFTLADPEGTLVFDGTRVGDTLTGTAALPTQVARQQGASGMTWRLVRRAPPAPPPYATREVRISAPGASLAGTLLVPRDIDSTTRRAAAPGIEHQPSFGLPIPGGSVCARRIRRAELRQAW